MTLNYSKVLRDNYQTMIPHNSIFADQTTIIPRYKIFKGQLQLSVYPNSQENVFPPTRSYYSMCRSGDRAFISGGRSAEIKTDIWYCSLPREFAWKRLSFTDPIPRYGHSMVKYKNELIIFGGFTTEESLIERDELTVVNFSFCLSRGEKREITKNI